MFQTLFRDKGSGFPLDDLKTEKRIDFVGGLSYGTCVQLRARPVHAAAARARADSKGAAVLRQYRHVRDGDEPPIQHVSGYLQPDRRRSARGHGHSGSLQGDLPAGRRDRHVRGRRHEPDGRRPCRLRRFRQLRAQRAGRGAEIRRGQRRRFLPRGKLHPYSGLYALSGCEIRPHHDQQHDLRHALGSHSRHGRRAAGRGYVLQHPQRGLRRANSA